MLVRTYWKKEWVVVKCLKKSKAIKSTKLIAIDCEMVLCEDGTDALVRVCAVDRNLKINQLPIIKTDITGISAKDLDGVTRSLKDVQISLKKILSHGTILVGHSVNNDLQGYELRKDGKPHNCVDDACAAMKLAVARLEGKIDDVITEEVKELDTATLLMHRIPAGILTKDLKSVLPGDCTIEVGKKAKNTYSANAVFKNQREAIEAFENLEGDLEKDSNGRPQKLVNFELDSGKTGTLCVCLREFPVGESTKKRSAEDDTPGGISKKLKTEKLDDPNQCEMHLKEIERLTKELKQRDEEISNQNKLIAALIRKQGL
ncbi:small rna degrading nuclease 1 [Phtheirospermum japonicum]|uniref:Small rna degrading nuclease 1 n=1 Tax=Phtheirospermum japonicum TaxID=374723 RepID=A0A830D911_9LAMI|nr:small rna degrading nuclease 1 [Phtheirospermum japonicum]